MLQLPRSVQINGPAQVQNAFSSNDEVATEINILERGASDVVYGNLLTLPVGLQRFFTEFATNWPGLMAASFIMSVPVVVLFLVLQKYFVRALTEGAVKS